MYLRNRYYNPKIGRFTQQDGWEYANSDDPLSLNLYTYSNNNPVRYTDPSGHSAQAVAQTVREWITIAEYATLAAGTAAAAPAILGVATIGGVVYLNVQVAMDPNAYANSKPNQNHMYMKSRGFIGESSREPKPRQKQGVAMAGSTPASPPDPDKDPNQQYNEIVGGKIKGYTKHGLNQAISRDGHGVKPESILDAVKNPVKTENQVNGAIKYIGENATVVLNKAGEVVTTWARNSSAWRIP